MDVRRVASGKPRSERSRSRDARQPIAGTNATTTVADAIKSPSISNADFSESSRSNITNIRRGVGQVVTVAAFDRINSIFTAKNTSLDEFKREVLEQKKRKAWDVVDKVRSGEIVNNSLQDKVWFPNKSNKLICAPLFFPTVEGKMAVEWVTRPDYLDELFHPDMDEHEVLAWLNDNLFDVIEFEYKITRDRWQAREFLQADENPFCSLLRGDDPEGQAIYDLLLREARIRKLIDDMIVYCKEIGMEPTEDWRAQFDSEIAKTGIENRHPSLKKVVNSKGASPTMPALAISQAVTPQNLENFSPLSDDKHNQNRDTATAKPSHEASLTPPRPRITEFTGYETDDSIASMDKELLYPFFNRDLCRRLRVSTDNSAESSARGAKVSRAAGNEHSTRGVDVSRAAGNEQSTIDRTAIETQGTVPTSHDSLTKRFRELRISSVSCDDTYGIERPFDRPVVGVCALVGGEASSAQLAAPHFEITEPNIVEVTVVDLRHFVTVYIGDKPVQALFDSGAMISLGGPLLVEMFKDRARPCNTLVRSVTGDLRPALGRVTFMVEIDGHCEKLDVDLVDFLEYDLILGVNFGKMWEVDTRMHTDEWRVRNGPWKKFGNAQGELGSKGVFARCAALAVVTDAQRDEIKRIALPYLPPDDGKSGLTTLVTHKIEIIPGSKPVRQPLRRQSEFKKELSIEFAENYLKLGAIQPSTSDWSSNPVIIQKPDKTYRFCVDYRDLNKVTVFDATPMPSLELSFDLVTGARYLTTLDMDNAFQQIEVEPDSRKYTAFSIQGLGLFEWIRLPFGLMNSPKTWVRLMLKIFSPRVFPYLIPYMDELLVATPDFESHKYWVEYALRKLTEAGIRIKLKKCTFCVAQVRYLGYLLDGTGLQVDPERVDAILSLKPPTTLRALRGFLGVIGWYARFIQNCSEIKLPLTKLTQANTPFIWSPEQQEAFETLKRVLTQAPVLARPDFSKSFSLQTDASDGALGATLTQVGEDDDEHPILYISRTLNKAERNYSVTERECLACVWAIRKLSHYLDDKHFDLYTDHDALKWLFDLKNPSGRLARWVMELQQWRFTTHYRKGALNRVPDFLSRIYENDPDAIASFDTTTDDKFTTLYRNVETQPAKHPDYAIKNGLLYRVKYDPLVTPIDDGETAWKLVVPADYQEGVISDCHIHPEMGHLGIFKTRERVQRDYYFKGLPRKVFEFVRSCPECQFYKVPQQSPQGLLGHWIVERPWVLVAIDLMEFTSSSSQNKYLVVMQDLFTKWVELKPIRQKTGAAVLKALEDNVIFRWGCPVYALTDNGREFVNKTLEGAMHEYGIEPVKSPPYHPQSNIVERANRTLKTIISIFVKTNHRTWDKYIPQLRFSFNTATSESLKTSPAYKRIRTWVVTLSP